MFDQGDNRSTQGSTKLGTQRFKPSAITLVSCSLITPIGTPTAKGRNLSYFRDESQTKAPLYCSRFLRAANAAT